jgi:nucleoside-diphosphate-sugar epimerase
MKIFIAGASGATGQKLTAQLLERGHQVVAVVRSKSSLPEELRNHENLYVIQASLLDLSDNELTQLVNGCSAVASCLGHNMTLKGMFGHPRRLVTDATRRLCKAIKANQPATPVRFVLMNTVGNSNRDLNEPLSFGERAVTGLLRTVLPPMADNEQAPEYLRTEIGQKDAVVEWAAVRPDSLLNEDTVTGYSVCPSPTTSAIFSSGQTSRINVGHFMAELITDDAVWQQWKGQMPVIYNHTPVNSIRKS